jgi:hypothetical protein
MRSRLAAVGAALTAVAGAFIVLAEPVGALTNTPSAMNSKVVVSRLATPADGLTEAVIIVTIDGQCDNPLAGKAVALKTSAPNTAVIHPLSLEGSVPGVTNDSGVAEFSVTDTTVESVTFSALDQTDGLVVNNQVTERFQTPATPPAATPEIAAPALLPLSALAVGGIAYRVKRRRVRQLHRAG